MDKNEPQSKKTNDNQIDKLVYFFKKAKGFGKAKTRQIRSAELLLKKFDWDVDRALQYWNNEEDHIKHNTIPSKDI